jgi:hypothetical protein
MSPTYNDIHAARLVVYGETTTHAQMGNLTGTDKCPHAFVPSGEPLDQFEQRMGYSSQWRDGAYRHHVYTEGRFSNVCDCGNLQQQDIHQHCWEGSNSNV